MAPRRIPWLAGRRESGAFGEDDELMPRLLSNIDDRLRKSLPRPAYRYVREGYHGARALVGLNPARRRLLPDFIVIGAAKSGTTSLYSALADHPFVEPCMTDNRYFDSTK